jgi:hypothetical protein
MLEAYQFKPGKPKGAKNKLPIQVNEMILTALSEAGGVAYLVRQAEEEPKAFLALVGKLVTRVIDQNNTHTIMGLADLLRSIPNTQPMAESFNGTVNTVNTQTTRAN